MPRTLFCSLRLFLVIGLYPLCAQDASLVLRTSVGYNTLRGMLTLTPELQKEAEQLGKDAQAASRAGNFGEAMRCYQHGTAVMRNVPWTPAVELASSLQGK